MEDLFFELLQVAVGNRKTLSVVPTREQWTELFAMAKKQALVGVAFAGVTRLNKTSDYGASLGIPEVVYLKWLGLVAKITQRNREMNKASEDVCKRLAHDGLASCILKGQSNLDSYPEHLRGLRTAGDIDVWAWTADPCGLELAVGDLDGKGAHYESYHGVEAVVQYSLMQARMEGLQHVSVRYNNTELPGLWGQDIEIHHRPSMMNSLVHNRRLQRWCEEYKPAFVRDARVEDCIFPIATPSFNAIYQLTHIYTHLFDEGIGLRQLLDYYFVLRALHIEQGSLADRTESMAQWAEGMGIAVKSNAEIMHTLGRFGLKKFAGAVMWVLAQVFDPREDIKTKTIKTPSSMGGSMNLSLVVSDWQTRWPWMICEPNEEEGKFLLNEIMQAGNFGKYDPRIIHNSQFIIHNWEKLKHNMRLIRHYPEEVLWEPFFRVYHWVWRKLELWRF